MSSPTVEIVEEGKLFVKLRGAYKSGAYESVSSQFKEWGGEGDHTGTELDQGLGLNMAVRHDIVRRLRSSEEAPWIGLFRYDQPFNEGKYYRIVPGETLCVPVPGVVVGRDENTNGFGNAADGGYGIHIFPLHSDKLLVGVYKI